MKHSSSVSQSSGKAQQFITAVIVNLATISYGIAAGWASPVMPQLRSSRPPVGDEPASDDEISWICSIPAIGGLLAIPFCGSLSERIGRKNFAIATGLPHVLSWLLIIFGPNIMSLYVARFVTGISIAMTMFIVPVMTSEIASEDIRGTIGSLMQLSINIGILIGYVAGTFLSYRLFASVSLVFPLVYVAAITFVPETPVYLARRDRLDQAHKSLMFYRGNNQLIVEQELMQLRAGATTSDKEAMGLSEFFKDRATRKGLLISLGLIAFQHLIGISAVIAYVGTILELVGSSVSPEMSLIIPIIQMIASQISTMLMERAGRRLLSLISLVGTTASLLVVATFFYLQRNQNDVSSISFLPLIGLSSFIVAHNLGIGPVSFVIISEVFKLRVISLATTLCFACFFVIGFLAIKTFDWMLQLRGPDGCFFMLAVYSVAGFVFCYSLLPETKGRTRKDIIDELSGISKAERERKALNCADCKLLDKATSV